MKFLVVSDFETPFINGKKSIQHDIIKGVSKLDAFREYFLKKYNSAKLDRDTDLFERFIYSFNTVDEFADYIEEFENLYFQIIEIQGT
jgi:hypothetical protein